MKQIKEFFEKYGVLTHEELPNGIGGLTCFVIDGTDEPIDIRGTEDKLYYLITTKKIIPIIKLNKTLNEHEKEYVFRHELGHLVYWNHTLEFYKLIGETPNEQLELIEPKVLMKELLPRNEEELLDVV